jgi:Protein of unknown function (DUF3306)
VPAHGGTEVVDRKDRGDGDDKQGFLKRWSRLKLEEAERRPADPEPMAEAPPENAAAGAPAKIEPKAIEPEPKAIEPKEESGAEPEAPFDPADLPDIDSLDKDSDFTGFLKEGVPAQLRHMALQKLFRSDPTLAVLDGLNDYDEDFTLAKVAEKIVSSYKPGRGYVDDEGDEDEIGDVEETDIETGDIEDEEGETGETENTESADAEEAEKKKGDT